MGFRSLLSRPRLGLAFGLLVLIAGVAYIAFWHVAVGLVRQGVDAWILRRQSEGYSIQHHGIAIDGFPFHIRLTAERPFVGAPPVAGWQVQGRQLVLSARPWRLGVIAMRMDDGARVDFPRWAIQSGFADGEARLDENWRLGDVTLRLIAPSATNLDGEVLAQSGVMVGRFAQPSPELRQLSLSVEGLVAPAAPELPVTGRGELSGELEVIGPWPPGRPSQSAEAWRRAGGKLELRRLAIDWKPIDLRASGTAALDRDLQPIASLSGEIRGHEALIDRLVADRVLPPGSAAIGKIALAVLSRPGPDGKPYVATDIRVQDRALWLGPLKLLPLAPLRWD